LRILTDSCSEPFFLDRIADPTTPEAISFRQVLGSIMGVKLAP
jgi:hypothetical protein